MESEILGPLKAQRPSEGEFQDGEGGSMWVGEYPHRSRGRGMGFTFYLTIHKKEDVINPTNEFIKYIHIKMPESMTS